jgi:hypothetical protein
MATILIPLDQYLHHAGDFEPDADYVDGEIEMRPTGQYELPLHSRLAQNPGTPRPLTLNPGAPPSRS